MTCMEFLGWVCSCLLFSFSLVFCSSWSFYYWMGKGGLGIGFPRIMHVMLEKAKTASVMTGMDFLLIHT